MSTPKSDFDFADIKHVGVISSVHTTVTVDGVTFELHTLGYEGVQLNEGHQPWTDWEDAGFTAQSDVEE